MIQMLSDVFGQRILVAQSQATIVAGEGAVGEGEAMSRLQMRPQLCSRQLQVAQEESAEQLSRRLCLVAPLVRGAAARLLNPAVATGCGQRCFYFSGLGLVGSVVLRKVLPQQMRRRKRLGAVCACACPLHPVLSGHVQREAARRHEDACATSV